jgi:glycerol-3-phosphate dehydrogenase
MRRATDRLTNETFDILIIGGGITGACVARDASLRGLKAAIVDKGDFAGATSAHNSKLIHGGLRYLRNFELGLVRESLRERRIWQRIAPHLVHPLPFLIPIHGKSWKTRATLAAGLTLYDVLSFDRAKLDDPAQRLPGHSWLTASDVRAREPVLDRPGLQGAFLYYDAQMYSPERLALECIIDADAHGAAVANYVEATGLLIRRGKVEGCTARDATNGAKFDIRARVTLVAAGPWADIFLQQSLSKPASHKLMRSKGIHIVMPAMTREFALTMATAHGHFFVLPWRGHTVLGTTDTPYTGKPGDVAVSERDISDFLAFVATNLPGAELSRSRVEHFYAGLRPLVSDGSSDTYDASRRSELVDHGKDDGLDGLFSAIGGKWTTSRHLAETVVDSLVEKLGTSARSCETATSALPGGRMQRFSAFRDRLSRDYPRRANIGHLAQLYGAQLPAVLSEISDGPSLLDPIAPTGDIAAQVLHAIRTEMALTLADVVMRRTGIGQLGRPPQDALDAVSKSMAAELGWSEEQRARETESLLPQFTTREAP